MPLRSPMAMSSEKIAAPAQLPVRISARTDTVPGGTLPENKISQLAGSAVQPNAPTTRDTQNAPATTHRIAK